MPINLVLINPNPMPYNEQKAMIEEKSIFRYPTYSMPLGFAEMVAYIRQSIDFKNIKLIDFGVALHKFYENLNDNRVKTIDEFIANEINKCGFIPDVIGLSLMFSSSYKVSMKTIEMAKKKWPNAVSVFGGNQATNTYKELLNEPNIDYVVRGEGEIALCELIKRIKNKDKNFNIAGVYCKNKLEEKHGSAPESAEMLADLTMLPMPAYDIVDMDYYSKTTGGSVMWTRGCPYPCTFCATTTVHGRKLRYKSSDQCASEIKIQIDQYDMPVIAIEDDLLGPKKSTFLDTIRKILPIKKNTSFEVPQGLSVAVMDEERIDALVRLGVNSGALAIETGSEYVNRHIMKKNVDLDKAKKILNYMRKVGFSATTNFILGSPNETDSMRDETIKYLKSIDVDWIYIFHALPLPGSEMFSMFEEVTDIRTIDWDSIRLGKRDFNTEDIDSNDLEKLVYETNIDANYFNNSNYRHKRYEKTIQMFNTFVLKSFPFHIIARYMVALSLNKLDRHGEAEEQFCEIARWIKTDPESKSLYNRFKDRMPELEGYLELTCSGI
jgi:anaerobic magnesium-protoporphyrin IX monomethyl ester cyclase